MKEVLTGQRAKENLIEGIEELCNAVLVTMGPMGRTVIISDEYGKPYVTKDGVSVANAVKFKDPVKNIGAQLIKEVAQKTADEAGDGTTTSICLAKQFIDSGLEILENEISSSKLQEEIDSLVKDTIKILKKNSKRLAKKDIYKVATISANNNTEIGKLIQKAYNHSPNVKVEEGKDKESTIESINGMVLPTSYFSPKFVNNTKRQEVNFEDAWVVVMDKKLESLDPLKVILQQAGENNKPVVIFTEHIADGPLRLLEHNAINKYLKVAVVKSPGFGTYRRDNLQDIADFTGAKVIVNTNNNTLGLGVIGTTKNIVVGKAETVLAKSDTIDVSEKIKDLEESFKVAKVSDYDKQFIRERIDRLTGTLAIIKVGGTSEVEMKETKDRVEDAVLAVRSALEEGIVEGGGIALSRAARELETTASNIRKTLLTVLWAPAFTINQNSNGKINAETESNRFEQNIIDPLKVTRCALENSASVAKTILSTEAIVLNEQLWR